MQISRGDVVVLTPVESGQPALVLGQRRLPAALGNDVGAMPSGAVDRLIHAVGLASSGLAATQALSGRWVELTKESAAKLAELGPSLDANGVPMAVLRDTNGHFDHLMRFESLGTASLAAASLMSGMAVQLALMRIERALEEVRQRVDLLIEASEIELEAALASALSVMHRIERRVNDQGIVDADDWASLAAIEAPIKAAYHQTVRWLDPLRQFLEDDKTSLLREVRALGGNLGIRDVGFWLRMYAYSELAMKRWEALYLLREAVAAPGRVGREGELLTGQARKRHGELLTLHNQIAKYLDSDRESSGRLDGVRLLTRSRLRRLRVELATAVNAYAAALGQIEVEVPDYAVAELVSRQGPLIDLDELQGSLTRTANTAIGAGTNAAQDVGRWLGGNATSLRQRVRPAENVDDTENRAPGDLA